MKSSNFYDVPITQEEYDAMLFAMSERLKNLAYATVLDGMRHVLDEIGIRPGVKFLHKNGDAKVTVTFPMEFIINDLVEIVAGLRRMEVTQ